MSGGGRVNTYIRQNDDGRASTVTRMNIPKSSPIFRLLGALDECAASLSVAKQYIPMLTDMIDRVCVDLESVAGEFAGVGRFVDTKQVERLTEAVATLRQELPESTGNTTMGGAQLELARAVARRAETEAVAMAQTGGVTKAMLAWLNRLPQLLEAMALLANASTQTAPVVSIGQIDGFCDKASLLCARVREVARNMGVRAVTAVCDAGGNPVALQRDDEAFIASVDIAMNKAFTSVSLKLTTEELATLAAPGGSLYGIQHTNGGKIVIFGGGIPLVQNGTIIGGFGVSGGTAEQDTALAHEAQRIFENEW